MSDQPTSEHLTVRFTKLHPDARPPLRGSALAAGWDLHAVDSLEIAPGERGLVATGIAVALPPGYELQLRPRSGLAFKHGVTLLNAPGTVDADYRGELKALLINHGDAPFRVSPGMRIAQAVVAQHAVLTWREVDTLDATDRGAGGFGHTGA